MTREPGLPTAFPPYPGKSTLPQDGGEYAVSVVPDGIPVIIAPTDQKVFVYAVQNEYWTDMQWSPVSTNSINVAVSKAGNDLLQCSDLVLYCSFVDTGTVFVFDIWDARQKRKASVREINQKANTWTCLQALKLNSISMEETRAINDCIFCKSIDNPNIVFFTKSVVQSGADPPFTTS